MTTSIIIFGASLITVLFICNTEYIRNKGEQLESWMYSQLTVSLENLNSVHDAMDGNDGVVEK